MIEKLLPSDEPEGDFIEFYTRMGVWAFPLAVGLSFARNRDAKWAIIHGLMGVPYLAYLGVQAVSNKEARLLVEADPALGEWLDQA
jgi:threonine/homoserine/homoserine lactone efflux protein